MDQAILQAQVQLLSANKQVNAASIVKSECEGRWTTFIVQDFIIIKGILSQLLYNHIWDFICDQLMGLVEQQHNYRNVDFEKTQNKNQPGMVDFPWKNSTTHNNLTIINSSVTTFQWKNSTADVNQSIIWVLQWKRSQLMLEMLWSSRNVSQCCKNMPQKPINCLRAGCSMRRLTSWSANQG